LLRNGDFSLNFCVDGWSSLCRSKCSTSWSPPATTLPFARRMFQTRQLAIVSLPRAVIPTNTFAAAATRKSCAKSAGCRARSTVIRRRRRIKHHSGSSSRQMCEERPIFPGQRLVQQRIRERHTHTSKYIFNLQISCNLDLT